MIHHASLGTNDVARSRKFYDAVLGVLGLTLLKTSEDSAEYGVSTVLFSLETPVNGKPASAGDGVHIAFDAGGRSKVDDVRRSGSEFSSASTKMIVADSHIYGSGEQTPDPRTPARGPDPRLGSAGSMTPLAGYASVFVELANISRQARE